MIKAGTESPQKWSFRMVPRSSLQVAGAAKTALVGKSGPVGCLEVDFPGEDDLPTLVDPMWAWPPEEAVIQAKEAPHG